MYLSLSGIRKTFDGVTALDGVSLEVELGEFVCFLGPSGCGKTTLLRIIAGLELPDAADIRLDGRNLLDIPARERNFGIVFQSYSLFPNMSVARNIAYGLECRKWPRQEIPARVAEMLALVNLADQADKLPSALSGGQQQRAAIARALANQAPVLLADEPTGNLDSTTSDAVLGLFAELAADGVHVGRKRVGRLMRVAGVQGVSRRKPHRTTRRDPGASPAPDLVSRDFAAIGPDRLWVADITYIPTWAGFLYFSLRVLHVRCAESGRCPRCVESPRDRLGHGDAPADRARPRRAEHGRGAAAANHRDPSLRPGLPVHLDHLWASLPRGRCPPVHGERGRRL